jgi:glycosyltransferase involved in cell wall biosynthesis
MTPSIRSSSPFFSVVVPVYNKDKYLRKTIESILNQTFRDFELLLVLDPSTDKSEEIARSFSDQRIRILNRDVAGSGGYAARNLGVAEAQADWVVFQDADDIWYDNHLISFWEALHSTAREAVVLCTSYVTETNGTLATTFYYRKFENQGDHYFDFEEFLLYKPICSINIAIRKSLFNKAGGFPENRFTRGADHETWLRILNISRGGYWIKSITAIYNKNVSDGVIKSSLPYTADHPVLLRVKELISNQNDPAVIFALKRYANSFVITGIKHRLRLGQLTSTDVSALFSEVHSNKFMFCFFKLFSYLPFWLQRGCMTIVYAFR